MSLRAPEHEWQWVAMPWGTLVSHSRSRESEASCGVVMDPASSVTCIACAADNTDATHVNATLAKQAVQIGRGRVEARDAQLRKVELAADRSGRRGGPWGAGGAQQQRPQLRMLGRRGAAREKRAGNLGGGPRTPTGAVDLAVHVNHGAACDAEFRPFRAHRDARVAE